MGAKHSQSQTPKLVVKRDYSSLDPFAQAPDPYEGEKPQFEAERDHGSPRFHKDGPPREQYGPPKNHKNPPPEKYGPPRNHNDAPREQYGPPRNHNNGPRGLHGPSRGPPRHHNNDGNNGPPMREYGPTEIIYHDGPPPMEYGPPDPHQIEGSPNQQYGPPRHMGNNYGPPRPYFNDNGPPRHHNKNNGRPREKYGPFRPQNDLRRPPKLQKPLTPQIYWHPFLKSKRPNKPPKHRPGHQIRYGPQENIFRPFKPENRPNHDLHPSNQPVFILQTSLPPTPNHVNRPRAKENYGFEKVKSIEVPVNEFFRSHKTTKQPQVNYLTQSIQENNYFGPQQSYREHLSIHNNYREQQSIKNNYREQQSIQNNYREQQSIQTNYGEQQTIHNNYQEFQTSNGQHETDIFRPLQPTRLQSRPSQPFQVPQKEQTLTAAYNNQEPQIVRHVSVHVPPPEPSQAPQRPKIVTYKAPEKQLQIIFVKAPSPAAQPPPEIHLPPQPKTRTVVYVMVKKPESNSYQVKIRKPPAAKPSKPEVFFIRYNDGENVNNQGSDFVNQQYGVPTQLIIDRPNDSYGAPSDKQNQVLEFQSVFALPNENNTTATTIANNDPFRPIYAISNTSNGQIQTNEYKNGQHVAFQFQHDFKPIPTSGSMAYESAGLEVANTGAQDSTFVIQASTQTKSDKNVNDGQRILGSSENGIFEIEPSIAPEHPDPIYGPLKVSVVGESPKYAYRHSQNQVNTEYRLPVLNQIPTDYFYDARRSIAAEYGTKYSGDYVASKTSEKVQRLFEVPNSNRRLGTVGSHYVAPGAKPFTKGSQRISK